MQRHASVAAPIPAYAMWRHRGFCCSRQTFFVVGRCTRKDKPCNSDSLNLNHLQASVMDRECACKGREVTRFFHARKLAQQPPRALHATYCLPYQLASPCFARLRACSMIAGSSTPRRQAAGRFACVCDAGAIRFIIPHGFQLPAGSTTLPACCRRDSSVA